MGNIVGEPFEEYVHDQINARQRIYGKTQNRSLEEISYLNSRNAWIKLASGVKLDKRRYELLQQTDPLGNPLVNPFTPPLSKEVSFINKEDFDAGVATELSTKIEYSYSKEIAKEYVLFNGFGDGNRAGITGDNKAYGVGGQDQGFSPMPGIVDADVKDLNRGSIKKATINIKAHNKNQFDIIDVLYLRLGYTIMLEWGTDKYWDDKEDKLVVSRTSLIDTVFFNDKFDKSDYSDILPLIEKEREKTRGNYDALFGTISNFSWTFNDDGSYDIKIEMISLGDVIESLKVNLPSLKPSIIDPNTAAFIQSVQATFSQTPAANLDSFFELYSEFDLETKIENYFNSVISDNKEYINYTPFDGADFEGYLFRYTLIAGQLRNIAEDDYGASEFNFDLSNSDNGAVTLLSNTLNYFNFLIPTLPEGSEGEELLSQQLNNLNTYFPRAILFSLALNANGEILGSGYSNPHLFYSSDSKKILRDELESIQPEFTYTEKLNLNGGWVNSNEEQLGVDTSEDLINTGIGNQFIEVDLTPESFYKNLGHNGLKDENGNLIRYNSVDLDFYTDGFDITPDEVPSYFILNAVKAESKPRNDVNKLIKNQRILFNNIDLQKFKIGIYQYFKLINAAGGQEDESFKDPEYNTTSDFLLGEQDKNIIYKYLFQVQEFGEKTKSDQNTQVKVFKQNIGSVINPTNGKNAGSWNGNNLFPFYSNTDDTRDIFKINTSEDNKGSYYIKLGIFLRFLQERVILKIDSNKKSKTPLIKIDTDINKNICYIIDNVISTDIRKCIIRNNSFYVDEGPPQQLFEGLDWYTQLFAPYSWGRIMQVYFSFSRLIEIIEDIDENGTITLFKLLKTICSDINESLGYINNIEPVVDKDTNTIRLIDQTPIPGIEEIGKYLGIKNFSNKESILEIFGYNQTSNDPSKYTSTFVNKAGITTEISKNYATMITIGATANGAVPGAESTAFSKWNIGIEDRFKENLISSIDNDSDIDSQNLNVIINYKRLIKYNSTPTKMFKIVGLSNNSSPSINPEQIKANTSTIPNYYKYAQAKTSLTSEELESSVGFLPFNLKLDMDGLSGIKIYNKINVNSSFLPSNYPQALKFIVTGVNHKLSGNDWKTSLNTIATSNSKAKKPLLIDTPNLLKLKVQPKTGETKQGEGIASGYGEIPGVCEIKSYPAREAGLESEYTKLNTQGNSALATKLLTKVFDSKKPGNTKGLCARYVKNISREYWGAYSDKDLKISKFKEFKAKSGTFSGPNKGRQDAKSKTTHQNLISKFGYTRYFLGKGLSRTEAKSIIDSITYYPGDIIIYWDNGGTSENRQKYGHIAMYLGGNRWISDFKHSSFVYSSGSCWSVIYLKSPDKPILVQDV